MPIRTSKITLAQRKLMKQEILVGHHRGKTPREIAVAAGCSLDHVYKTLPKLLDQEAIALAELSKREIVTQIGRLNRAYSEVYAQWEKSCGERKETNEKTEGTFDSAEQAAGAVPAKMKSSSSTTKTEGLGDPRYIEQMRAIMADIRRLLRLDKDETLKDVLANISLTQVNVTTAAVLHPITLPEASEIAALMGQFGMNSDGSAKALPGLEVTDADVIEAG